MSEFGRRIVVDVDFETAVCELSRAIREHGLQTLARIDVRDRFWRDLAHDFRQYVIVEAWSPHLALEALRTNLDLGTLLPTTFAAYALADGETAIVVKQPLAPAADEPEWRRQFPALAGIADQASAQAAGVIETLRHRAAQLAATHTT
jgi:uncharacterized protein (DUF302 family)